MNREYLGHLLPATIEEKITPRQTAVVVVDVQNDFVHPDGYFGGSPALQAIVEPIRDLTVAARAAGAGVHFIRIEQEADGSSASAVWISEALGKGYEPRQCIAGTWGAQIVDELSPLPGDHVHVKRRRSSFRGTRLEQSLRKAGVRSVIVTGLAANGCVEYTARDAFELDFHPIVAFDAIANATDQPGHSWAPHYAAFLPEQNLVTTGQITSIWKVPQKP
ncbi:cysteine hydrolase family protein [Sphaerimonospora thailandensis]|uniref:Isochorismatase n=1 Tax=Sphaerimonospora thailandensis TaxID=795644 RepID=A0A8J3RAH2_9ACTN|nr:isochorismatase family cysteine hydrolase [Sphaerimonospora thailandensis]GIH72401.1 isochorismatase [Sphaerimonospora thailandensis]